LTFFASQLSHKGRREVRKASPQIGGVIPSRPTLICS
jgi:hypothetical protein